MKLVIILVAMLVAAICAIINVRMAYQNVQSYKMIKKLLAADRKENMLNESQRARICSDICRYKNGGMDAEELEWQCCTCPLND